MSPAENFIQCLSVKPTTAHARICPEDTFSYGEILKLTSVLMLNGEGGDFGRCAEDALKGPDSIFPVLVASSRARLPAELAPLWLN